MAASAKTGEIIEMLAEGVLSLTSSKEWERYLLCQSQFYRYSYGNTLLILRQMPSATQVAGFNSWQKIGRTVRKGEKALWILAPMVVKAPGDQSTLFEATGDLERAGGRRRIVGFKRVPVFDVSQTEGEAVTSVCRPLEHDAPESAYASLVAVAASLGFTVQDHVFEGERNGDCTHGLRRIRVHASRSGAQRTKTLAHEIGHAILHEDVEVRSLAELEAESVAYVVCHALGIDTSAYSFGYVAGWAGDGEVAAEAIKRSCSKIQRAAVYILDFIEKLGTTASEIQLAA